MDLAAVNIFSDWLHLFNTINGTLVQNRTGHDMRKYYHSLYQRSSVEDQHRVEEQAWQEEVETGSEQPRELQKRKVGKRGEAS